MRKIIAITLFIDFFSQFINMRANIAQNYQNYLAGSLNPFRISSLYLGISQTEVLDRTSDSLTEAIIDNLIPEYFRKYDKYVNQGYEILKKFHHSYGLKTSKQNQFQKIKLSQGRKKMLNEIIQQIFLNRSARLRYYVQLIQIQILQPDLQSKDTVRIQKQLRCKQNSLMSQQQYVLFNIALILQQKNCQQTSSQSELQQTFSQEHRQTQHSQLERRFICENAIFNENGRQQFTQNQNSIQILIKLPYQTSLIVLDRFIIKLITNNSKFQWILINGQNNQTISQIFYKFQPNGQNYKIQYTVNPLKLLYNNQYIFLKQNSFWHKIKQKNLNRFQMIKIMDKFDCYEDYMNNNSIELDLLIESEKKHRKYIKVRFISQKSNFKQVPRKHNMSVTKFILENSERKTTSKFQLKVTI